MKAAGMLWPDSIISEFPKCAFADSIASPMSGSHFSESKREPEVRRHLTTAFEVLVESIPSGEKRLLSIFGKVATTREIFVAGFHL